MLAGNEIQLYNGILMNDRFLIKQLFDSPELNAVNLAFERKNVNVTVTTVTDDKYAYLFNSFTPPSPYPLLYSTVQPLRDVNIPYNVQDSLQSKTDYENGIVKLIRL